MPTSDTPQPIRAKIRRWYVPDAIYFVTAVTLHRRPLFREGGYLDLLRQTMHEAKVYHPFSMRAYAYMPDHLHMLIYVPATTNISKLLQSIQRNFTLNYKDALSIHDPLKLWQRGFWDHVIRDEDDLERHFDYIHYNPVKHGYAATPAAYPHTSFHEYLRRGWYGPNWAEDVELDRTDFEP